MRRLLAALAVLVLAQVLPAAAPAAERVALVIGMGRYAHIAPLDNTVHDARGVADTLRGIGFDVTLAIDTPGAELREILGTFAFNSETADLALIYYAGHGVQLAGQNYLIPVDADVRSSLDLQRQSISQGDLLAAVDHARRMRVVILDSCRNNPLGGIIDTSGTVATEASTGLAAPSPDRGTVVAFAARDGQVALDGRAGGHSPFAQALIERMPVPGLEISLMFRQVRDEVMQATGNLQEPYTYGSLSGEPFFLAADGANVAAAGDDPAKVWSATFSPAQEPQLKALAELGDARSLLGLAYLRMDPASARFDPGQAADYLQRAAAAGEPEAQWQLARFYERGQMGLPIDRAKALALYEASAAQEYDKALNDMGYFYYQGDMGLKQDTALALDFFRRAADQRHPEAQYNYAALIDDGLVAGKGPADAARYLYEALRSGNESVLQVMTDRPNSFTLETRKALQEELKRYGFYPGTVDGVFGPGTLASIREAFGIRT